MKFLMDMFPVILFFGVFKWGEGHADSAQALVSQYLSGLVSGGSVGFGGATIYFHNEAFIKWKPTVLYWVFAVVLMGAQILMGKNLIRLMMKAQIDLPDPIWNRVNMAWAAFFAAMGIINLYVAFNFSTSTWVNFKLFGFTGMMIVFVVAQTMFLSKYIKDPS